MKEMKLCFVGFGNAAREFCRILDEKVAYLRDHENLSIKVVGIATKSRGSIIDFDGIDVKAALKLVESGRSLEELPHSISSLTGVDHIKASKADVLVELSTLSVRDGQPAISHIEAAFELGMHVITANKGPVAWAYEKLKRMAASKGLHFLHETTVMDGTPIYNLCRYTLPGCKVLSIKGVLNATTNFILEEMEKGNSFEAAVSEAQRNGFAEADPSMDVDGWDAAFKVTCLINVLMGSSLKPTDIERKGIGDISLADVQKAAEEGLKYKLVCESFLDSDGRTEGRVRPELVESGSMYGNIDSTTSLITIVTDLMGPISVIEHNGLIRQTAYGIYSDLLTLNREIRKGSFPE